MKVRLILYFGFQTKMIKVVHSLCGPNLSNLALPPSSLPRLSLFAALDIWPLFSLIFDLIAVGHITQHTMLIRTHECLVCRDFHHAWLVTIHSSVTVGYCTIWYCNVGTTISDRRRNQGYSTHISNQIESFDTVPWVFCQHIPITMHHSTLEADHNFVWTVITDGLVPMFGNSGNANMPICLVEIRKDFDQNFGWQFGCHSYGCTDSISQCILLHFRESIDRMYWSVDGASILRWTTERLFSVSCVVSDGRRTK